MMRFFALVYSCCCRASSISARRRMKTTISPEVSIFKDCYNHRDLTENRRAFSALHPIFILLQRRVRGQLQKLNLKKIKNKIPTE